VVHTPNRKKRIEESRELLNSYLANTALMLSTPVRLTILTTLVQAPRTVEELAEATSQSMANVSQHLAKLKTARLVESEKRGVQRVYRLASAEVHNVVTALQALARSISSEVEQAENTLIAPALRTTTHLKSILNDIKSNRANLIDVRTHYEQESTPVPDAITIPVESDGDLQKVLESTPKDKRVYVFCRGAYCATASRTAEFLREHGVDAWCLRETALDLNDTEAKPTDKGKGAQ
jgi:DNA-binding transcriptional ArsR family regulator